MMKIVFNISIRNDILSFMIHEIKKNSISLFKGLKMNFKKYISSLFFLILIGLLYFFYNRLHQQIEDLCNDSTVTEQDQILADFEANYVAKKSNKDQCVFNDETGKPSDLVVEELSGQSLEPIKTLEVSTANEASSHLFKELERKNFYTKIEKLELFAELGIGYLNGMVFDYAPALNIDPKESEKYTKDIDGNNDLSDRYGADIKAKVLMPMSIRWINEDVGHGIFAEEDLSQGGFIGIYGGIIQERVLIKERDYAWAYPIKTLEGDRLIIDAGKRGNELRFINDGINPNCVMKNIIGPDGLWYVCYIALKDIKKGDQLLISYGPSYWDTRKYNYQELLDCK